MLAGYRILHTQDAYRAFFIGPIGLERALWQPFLMPSLEALSPSAREASVAATWLPATFAWLGVGCLGVVFASRVHTDT